VLEGASRDFDFLRAFLADQDIEGIVFRHTDGRKAKSRSATLAQSLTALSADGNSSPRAAGE